MMTRQEAFNRAYLGLKAQGFVRSTDGAKCAYRGEDGRKCAVGHLLTDEQAASIPNTDAVSSLDLTRLGLSDAVFLTRLQACHDYGITPEGMRFALEKLAKDEGLTIPEEA